MRGCHYARSDSPPISINAILLAIRYTGQHARRNIYGGEIRHSSCPQSMCKTYGNTPCGTRRTQLGTSSPLHIHDSTAYAACQRDDSGAV
eukprot:862972-Pyramimonas_sp.AAC.3